jgi:hypothetical protein
MIVRAHESGAAARHGAYDKFPLSTAAKSWKSGLFLNSSYVSATHSLAWLERADASFAERDLPAISA